MKRTNFYFSEELLKRVRAYAEKTGQTSSDVIRTAIEQYLGEREADLSADAKIRQMMASIQDAVHRMAAELRAQADAHRAVQIAAGLASKALSAELKANPGPALKALKKPRKKRGGE